MIRYEAKLIVSVDQRVRRLGHGDERQGVVSPLDMILNHARQKSQLFNKMGILRRVDLGDFQLERGEFFVDSLEDFRCDLFRAVMEELCYLRHAGRMRLANLKLKIGLTNGS